jgi:MFS family permease
MESAGSSRTRSGGEETSFPSSPSEANPYESPHGASREQVAPPSETAVYDSVFWSCYLANFLMMTSLSMLARYSDFVKSIGGDETRMGWIVGVGAFGAMVARLFQGQWIDRVGARFVWLLCLAVTTAMMLAHVIAGSADSPYIFVVRLIMWMAVAGNFSASITLVSRRAPLHRVAEAVGTLGSSGFIGLALGPLFADWILGEEPTREGIVRWIFACSGIFALAWIVTWVGAKGERTGSIHENPPLWATLRRYSPWPLLVMSFVTGAGLNLPTYYVRPYSVEIGIEGVGTFFVAYGMAAFGFRWLTRTWPQRFGSFPVTIAGAVVLVISVLSYLTITSVSWFIVPAFFLGLAHALLFPAVVGGISIAFPKDLRGLGTTLALAAFDMGNLVGTPLAGEIIYFAKRLAFRPYVAMFIAMALFYAALSVVYVLGEASLSTPDPTPDENVPEGPTAA